MNIAKSFWRLFNRITSSSSTNEDTRRKKFICNVILLGVIGLSFMALLSAIINSYAKGNQYEGVSSTVCSIIFLSFVSLFVLNKKTKSIIASYILIIIFLLPTIYTIYLWGVDIPTGLLAIVLVIVMSGILISSTFSFFATLALSVIMLLLFYRQNTTSFVDLSWKSQPIEQSNIWVFIVLFGVICIISWLSNREIERSLKRARKSESELREERNSLEIKVVERTKELKKAEEAKMAQIVHLAKFGRLAAGIVHDIANPLTAVSLNLEQLQSTKVKGFEKAKKNIEEALIASKRMENFVIAVKKQLQLQEELRKFSLNKEIEQAISVLSYKTKKENVTIKFEAAKEIVLFGNSIKMNQAITNLLADAIDSYKSLSLDKKRIVEVKIKEKDDNIEISVQDYGKGIPAKNISKIFDPFFTTKDVSEGTGIGLTMVKDVVEHDFLGEIKVKSKENIGTIFFIDIPRNKALV